MHRCYDGAACGAVSERLGMINTAAASSSAITPVAKKTLCKAGSRTLTGIALVVDEIRPPIPRLSDALAIAPKTAMPIALPIDLANTLVPVTTPRRSQSTADCAAIKVGLATSPIRQHARR